ncbi:MAG: LL-diaminopimelate aminotransferase [Dehalococcoidia bacterium]|nr:LL-diaminopimelate aminotransferase [Dehalococcoidia bacterium]MQF99914.1 aminotransferase class I/II-fold pyridoxal phosphate-dependent enzyme [SAR202 cluster bacterium]
MNFAKRIEQLPPYLFVEISKTINRKRAEGADVVTFAIGDPDIPTPQNVLDKLWEAAQDPPNHRYPESEGLPELRQAIANWYDKRFGVKLNPDTEVLPLIGAKEGIGHAALCFIDPGDIALVPDPGYPVYSIGTLFAGGECHWLPLTEENGWLPDLDSVPSDIAQKAKVLWLNYPNNPTGAIADSTFFAKAVAFSQRHNVPVLHDAPYTEVAYDGYVPESFLQTPGSMDVGLEFHSLSKSYNMTGWRIGMAVGNAEMINALMRVKSNLDSGIPQAIQYAAIEALNGPQDSIDYHNRVYQDRRDKLVAKLREIGLEVTPPKASLYVWAKLPAGWKSADFAAMLIEEKDIVVTPGAGYGKYGEGYIRLSLTLPDSQLEKGLSRLSDWKIPNPPAN